MATQQANRYTRREIEAAEALVSFHYKTVEFVGPREVATSHQLHPVMVPRTPAAAQSPDRQQMPPPPLPLPRPFQASRQVQHGQVPSQRHGGQVYGQAPALPPPAPVPHLHRVPVQGQGAQYGPGQGQAPGSATIHSQYAAMARPSPPAPAASPSPAPRQEQGPAARPRAQPGYSYRCYMCDHTIQNRLGPMVNHMVNKHGVTRENVDMARLEDTKVQMLW
ncbi:hypothetical protein A1O7_01972 [Cladophialophora yegresii CBS 114405]|uniref:Uncharacterized protein n=1 Tax=Cladophialophora yegresii CBS 114405 TaxID=1182544 RepID=W9WT81_9EURO|nr:uncharacterized protein A1O7_01972 [Cladophialophora yegresii CBS 114405]EXJ61544.1 hypothetical protein A1O7_01972 [Cladophialophora yegresii CBS 114405]